MGSGQRDEGTGVGRETRAMMTRNASLTGLEKRLSVWWKRANKRERGERACPLAQATLPGQPAQGPVWSRFIRRGQEGRTRKEDILILSQSNQVFLDCGSHPLPTVLSEVHFYTFGLLGQYPKNKTSPETGVTQHRIPVLGRIYC